MLLFFNSLGQETGLVETPSMPALESGVSTAPWLLSGNAKPAAIRQMPGPRAESLESHDVGL